jgi:hypothetical protein
MKIITMAKIWRHTGRNRKYNMAAQDQATTVESQSIIFEGSGENKR